MGEGFFFFGWYNLGVQDIYEKLEFPRVREEIASFARTERGKEMATSLLMLPSYQALFSELQFVQESLSLYYRYGRMPIDVSSDLTAIVEFARKGGTLSVENLERAAYDVTEAKGIRQFFKSVGDLPLLLGYIANFPTIDFLEKDIHKVIAPDLSIFDNASPKLKGIRVAMKRLEAEMKKKLGYVLDQNKVYLSDTMLTLKNGHYVLPVANAYKNKVRGIVQDTSGSGETTFIEPEVLVELNNKMVELHNDERTEIQRLLHELSQEVAGSGDSVLLNNEMIARLDFLQSKALYAEKYHAHVADLSKTPFIDLVGARHPLIDQTKVVPNSFHLDEKTSLIVISGPNAGGKTVAIKTLGLMVLMNQAGLAIPADEGSSLSYFSHIFVDIGDSQSLSDNLSTFSGHMANLSSILSNVGGKDLILLDEVGTGTSPKEGEAIAFAIIEYLIKKHAFTLVSSHFEGLKAYALSHEEITNASMIFDEEKLLPTYKLKMGLPGESYGLIVAARYGLPEAIVASAKDYLFNHEETSVSSAIAKLAAVTRTTEEEKAKCDALIEENRKKEAALASKEAALNLRQEHYLSDVEDRKRELLSSYQDKMDAILQSVKNGEVKLHEVISAKKKLDDLQEEAKIEKFTGPIEIGDYVNIPSLYTSGTVKEIQGGKANVVSREGISFKVKVDRLVKVEAPKEEKREEAPIGLGLSPDEVAFKKSVPLELNLIGEHVDEAKLDLEKYLDECRLKHYKRVRIIHGWGSGALRGVVRDYCASHPEFIASVEGANGNEGGGGASILFLK